MLFIEPSLSPIPERYVSIERECPLYLILILLTNGSSLDDDESDRSITQNQALSFNARLAMEIDDRDAENEAASPKKRPREPPNAGNGPTEIRTAFI
jgi:hypothetical protein